MERCLVIPLVKLRREIIGGLIIAVVLVFCAFFLEGTRSRQVARERLINEERTKRAVGIVLDSLVNVALRTGFAVRKNDSTVQFKLDILVRKAEQRTNSGSQ